MFCEGLSPILVEVLELFGYLGGKLRGVPDVLAFVLFSTRQVEIQLDRRMPDRVIVRFAQDFLAVRGKDVLVGEEQDFTVSLDPTKEFTNDTPPRDFLTTVPLPCTFPR